MSHNILVTGASGYLGGTLLAHWKDAGLPPYAKLYALVRSEEQREAVTQYGAEALVDNLKDHQTIIQKIIDLQISVVYFLIDAYTSHRQQAMIGALGKVREQTGREVHFLHTGGAKHYSNHAGMPTDRPLFDTDQDLYETLKNTKSPHDMMATVCDHYYPPFYVPTDTLFLIGSLFKPTSMSSTPLKLVAYAATSLFLVLYTERARDLETKYQSKTSLLYRLP